MAGNSFGRLFCVTTFGESHGPAIGAVVDGMPPGIEICETDIQAELDRRRPGQSAVSTPRSEKDAVEILSGIFDGKTTGTPIALLIRNEAQKSGDYEKLKSSYRPGHADFTYVAKYGLRDWRGGGRSSGRETAARVAAGALAKKLLALRGVSILGYSLEIAGVRATRVDESEIERNPVRSPDLEAARLMSEKIEAARAAGDSVGGIAEVVASGCPAGLGDPVFDKLEALLAHAVMSVGAVRGVEIGAGFTAARMQGSQYNDELYAAKESVRSRTNNAGGTLGGISTGEDIVIRAVFRPPASISLPQTTIDDAGTRTTIKVEGRHDPCVVPRAVPVMEAMVALVLADCLLVQDACDSTRDLPRMNRHPERR
jgi:chorismate synthase